MRPSTVGNTSMPQSSAWHIGVSWGILMLSHVASTAPVAQGALRNGHEPANHCLFCEYRVLTVSNQACLSVGRLSSMSIGATDMKASHPPLQATRMLAVAQHWAIATAHSKVSSFIQR